MAILYLGDINNKSKRVSKLYIGINNQAKLVTKAYIGVNNKAKLFYSSDASIDIDLKQLSFIKTITDLEFNPPEGDYTDLTYGKYAYYSSETLYLSNKIQYAYLNSNCYALMGLSSVYSFDPDSYFKKIRFDKVTDLSYAFQVFMPGHLNLSNLKYFNNVQNMENAFQWSEVTGEPIKAFNAINMMRAYNGADYIFGNIFIGEKVTHAQSAFENAGINTDDSYFLNLASCNIGRYKSINLSDCFRNCKVHGRLNIYNYSSNLNNMFLDRYYHDKSYIYVHMPSSKTLSQLNSYLSAYKICNSGEKHVIIQESSCIDIQTSTGASFKVRFYNDLPI